MEEIEAAYRGEHPDWTDEQVKTAAQVIHRTLRQLERDWYNSNRRFFRHTVLTGARVGERDDLDQNAQ